MGILYLVATPIGNLNDITLRAIEVLKQVDIIAAEDTRHTLKLLNHLNIKKPLISYYREIEKTKSEILIKKILEGKNIALVSDAGTPAISDPGEEIVSEAIKNNIEIHPIPGACAFVNALICSGLNTREFIFIGFLPTNNKEKKEKLNKLKNENKTLIFYESPHKIKITLENMLEIFGNRKIVLAKEISKIHEEFIRGTIDEVLEKSKEIKGEIVILIEGTKQEDEKIKFLNSLSLEEHYQYYSKQHLDKKEIIKKIAKDRSKNKNEIYQYFLNK
jgi:16S rRNA (cytidine1402-2'-O)-methyltransferase